MATAALMTTGSPYRMDLVHVATELVPVLAFAASQSSTGLAFCAWPGQPKATDVRSGVCRSPAYTHDSDIRQRLGCAQTTQLIFKCKEHKMRCDGRFHWAVPVSSMQRGGNEVPMKPTL